MADLREKVIEDRGIIAKIQSIIPGFSGYRTKEDLRAADSMLRIQIADRLAAVRKDLEGCRAVMTDNLMLEGLDKLGALINRFKAIEGEIRHAEQGYSGVSAKVRVGEDELNRLYEYDFALISAIAALSTEVVPVRAAADAGDSAGIKAGITKIGSKLTEFEESFKKRMMLITNTEV